MDTLNSLDVTQIVSILQATAHRNIVGNERADGITKQSSANNPSVGVIGVPLATIKSGIYSHNLITAEFR